MTDKEKGTINIRNVSKELMWQVKLAADKKHMSVRDYQLQAIKEKLERDNESNNSL